MDALRHGSVMAHGKDIDVTSDFSKEINWSAKGKRPQFLGDKSQEHLMSMTLALLQELAVTRERLDTLERILDKQAVVAKSDIDGFAPDEEASAERQARQHQLISTVMRSLEQEVHAMKQQPAETSEPLHVVQPNDRVA